MPFSVALPVDPLICTQYVGVIHSVRLIFGSALVLCERTPTLNINSFHQPNLQFDIKTHESITNSFNLWLISH